MTHPHRLHAAAALHSLRAALPRLATQADAEAKAIAAEHLEAADGLHGWTPSIGGPARGGHGDPVSGAVLSGERGPRVNRYAVLAASTTATLEWLADQLRVPATPDPIDGLQAAVTGLQPAVCARLTRWVQEADQRIRTALNLGAGHWLLPDAATCPACHVRLLYAQTSPRDTADWTIVCGHRCVCAGGGCSCGMPVREAGVPHIWAAGSDLAVSAFAGATLTSGKAA